MKRQLVGLLFVLLIGTSLTPAAASASVSPLGVLLNLGTKTCHKYVGNIPNSPPCHGNPKAKISQLDMRFGSVTSPIGGYYSGSIFQRSTNSSSDWKLVYRRGSGSDSCSFVSAKFNIPPSVLNEFKFCFDDSDFSPPGIDLVGAVPTTVANLFGSWTAHAVGLVVDRNGSGDFQYARFDGKLLQNAFFEIKFKINGIKNEMAGATISESNDPQALKGSAIKLIRTQIGVNVVFPTGDFYPTCDQPNRLAGQCGA